MPIMSLYNIDSKVELENRYYTLNSRVIIQNKSLRISPLLLNSPEVNVTSCFFQKINKNTGENRFFSRNKMSLIKTLSGRKRECGVWIFFEYNASKNRSKCMVAEDKTGAECGQLITGKNTTNLKKHLQVFHPAQFAETEKKDEARVAGKRPTASSEPSSSCSQTLTECLNRKIVTWDSQSPEHGRREQAMVNMFVDTGYPATSVDNPKFRQFCSAMDPKFKVPGNSHIGVITNY